MMKVRVIRFIFFVLFACLASFEAFADEKELGSAAKQENMAEKLGDSAAANSKLEGDLPSSEIKSDNPADGDKSAQNQDKKSVQKKSSKSKSSKSSKSSSGRFSKDEIARYKAMPFETWESPVGVSEKGLPIAEGFTQPYPYGNLMRQYNGNKCRHRGLDIGAVGDVHGGVGTVVNAVTRSVVTLIGRTGQNTKEFGKQDKRSGTVKRTGKKYPRQILVPGYGLVYPFSRTYGRWRSGMVIVTKVLDGPLKDYTIRYMHLADIRPDLKEGSIVEAGEHIGLMGGTAVMDSWPHVHMDMETPEGRRADLAPYIGLPDTSKSCTGKSSSKKGKKSKKSSKKKTQSKKGSKKSKSS